MTCERCGREYEILEAFDGWRELAGAMHGRLPMVKLDGWTVDGENPIYLCPDCLDKMDLAPTSGQDMTSS